MATVVGKFDQGLYRTFRAPRDLAGLEALDSGCDLKSPIDAVTLTNGTETNPARPVFGFKFERPMDRIRFTLMQLQPMSGQKLTDTPSQFTFQVVLGHHCAGEDISAQTVVKSPKWTRSGLIFQCSNLLFDNVQVWAGNVSAQAGTEQQLLIRVMADRNGGTSSERSTDGVAMVNVLYGPFT